jgi:hypothetical protein
METLQSFFSANNSSDIFTIGRYIQQHVDEQSEAIFQSTQREMLDRYDEIGDSVYGIYGTHLFRHIHAQFKEAGLRSKPRLPFGNFATSREWGDEDDRQRWFWSKITTTDDEVVGTIAVVCYHDHLQIRIPRPFKIIALAETSKGAVVKALSQISDNFGKALEARNEYAQYYAEAENSQS